MMPAPVTGILGGGCDDKGVPLCLLPLASGGDYRACNGVTI